MVSGNPSPVARPATADHQAKTTSRPVRLAVITYGDGVAACSCGWLVRAQRAKVIENTVDRHLDKNHDGRGIRI